MLSPAWSLCLRRAIKSMNESGWGFAESLWSWQGPCGCWRGTGQTWGTRLHFVGAIVCPDLWLKWRKAGWKKSDIYTYIYIYMYIFILDVRKAKNRQKSKTAKNVSTWCRSNMFSVGQGIESCSMAAMQQLRDALRHRQQSNALLTVTCRNLSGVKQMVGSTGRIVFLLNFDIGM